MPHSTLSKLFSEVSGEIWIQKILPQIWAELCTEFGILSGVIVLKGKEGDSFYESASFGYGEEGFYYSFLASGTPGWKQVMDSAAPVDFSGDEFESFHEGANVKVVRVGNAESPLGFVLAEHQVLENLNLETMLYLLAEKISKELIETYLTLPSPVFSINESPSQKVFRDQIPNLDLGLQRFSKERILTILGPPGSGKKTLAKWVHSQVAEASPFLLIESLPENFGKLEKSLQAWAGEVGNGTLVFPKLKVLGLGQKQIFWAWYAESQFKGRLVFVDGVDVPSETLPEFERLLQKNSIYLPGLNFLPKPILREQILMVFSELISSQNRSGLKLSQAALDSLLESTFPGNFAEIRNVILSAILTCKGSEIQKEDVIFGDSRLDLEVPDAEDLDLRRGIQALERQKILLAMRIFSNNQIRMAKALGISRGSLQYKMKQLGLI